LDKRNNHCIFAIADKDIFVLKIVYKDMSRICQITGKRAIVGNNVAHSNHKTKRKFNVNLFSKKIYWAGKGCWINLNISANGLRTINKIGLDAAIKQASKKGNLIIDKDGKERKRK